jgi:hypothetical protein
VHNTKHAKLERQQLANTERGEKKYNFGTQKLPTITPPDCTYSPSQNTQHSKTLGNYMSKSRSTATSFVP